MCLSRPSGDGCGAMVVSSKPILKTSQIDAIPGWWLGAIYLEMMNLSHAIIVCYQPMHVSEWRNRLCGEAACCPPPPF